MKLVKKIQGLFFRTKIQKQLNVVYLFTILLSMIVISMFLIFSTYRLMLKHYNEQVEADNLRVKSVMYDITTNIYSISNDIFSNSSLQNILSTTYASTNIANQQIQSFDAFSSYLKSYPSIKSIMLYTTNASLGDSEFIHQVTPSIERTDWYQRTSTQPPAIWYSGTFMDSWKHSYQSLQLIRKIPIVANNEYAILVITISNDYVKNRVQFGDFKTIISVDNGPIFYSTDRDYIGKDQFIPMDKSKNYFQYNDDHIMYKSHKAIGYLSTYTPIVCNDTIYMVSLDTSGWHDIYHFTTICIFIVFFSITIPCIFVLTFTNIFNKRFTILRQEMHKVSHGDYNLMDDLKGDDELALLFEDLKVMIESIKKMDAEIYQSTIDHQHFITQQEKMKFSVLASQINPHFLYNTLESIRMKSLMEGNEEVADAIMMLGKSMRYVLENNQSASTSLKNELDYIELYLSIQKLRFGDKINYEILLDPDLDAQEYTILPLLIQPIVENAFIHGLKKMDHPGHIRILIEQKKMTVNITISDDGCGISKEKLLQIKETMQLEEKKDGTSIGIRNIYQRIKLYYGLDYDILIESQLGCGTTVTLILPITPIKEEAHV